MDVQAKLAEIRQLVERARSMPMSASVVLNRGELLTLVDELEAAMQEAFREAERVISEKQSVVQEGRDEADRIVADARNEREHIVSDTEVFRVAQRQAEEVLARAREEAEETRREIDDYVDGRLANFEITLQRTIDAVARGRQKLAGRSAYEGINGEAVEQIKLPEHLEG